MARDVLVCTVGTSLLGNCENDDEPGSPVRDLARASNWPGLVAALRRLDPLTDRRCGAEINSIASMDARGLLADRQRLRLLASDTHRGRAAADCVRRFFAGGPLGFSQVEVQVVQGLNDEDPDRFRTQGLRALVQELMRAIRIYGPDRVAINATGGYKAHIALAALVGQVLRVPCYYRFEAFDHVIALPPLPVALDMQVWMERQPTLARLDKMVAKANLEPEDRDALEDERFAVLVEEVEEGGQAVLGLSLAGQVFYEAGRSLLPARLPPPRPAHPPPEMRLDNAHVRHLADPARLQGRLERLAQEAPYVRRIRSQRFVPQVPGQDRFRVGAEGGQPVVVAVLRHGPAAIELVVDTTAETEDQLRAAAADLAERWSASGA